MTSQSIYRILFKRSENLLRQAIENMIICMVGVWFFITREKHGDFGLLLCMGLFTYNFFVMAIVMENVKLMC